MASLTACYGRGITNNAYLCLLHCLLQGGRSDDPQTEADRAAQRCIISSLRHQFPTVTVIGEEVSSSALSASLALMWHSRGSFSRSQYSLLSGTHQHNTLFTTVEVFFGKVTELVSSKK